MSSKRCYAYPLLVLTLHANLLRQAVQVTTFGREDRLKLVLLDGESKFGKHLYIVVKRCRQLLANLVLFAHQLSAHLAMLVDMLHLEMTHVKAHSQVFRTQHRVQVGHMRKLLGPLMP